MTFDVSIFADIGRWIFVTFKSLYTALIFDFGDFTLNGWYILLGVAIVSIIFWFLGRISE